MLTRGIAVVSVLCLVLPGAAFAQGFTQGDKELLLSGSGISAKDFDSTIFSISGSLGYFFTGNIEGSFRQAFSFTNTDVGGSSWGANSRVAVDYNFDMGRFWPFAGANVGYVYGDNVSDSWTLGLEGGLKFFVNTTTFLLGSLEYQWLLDGDDEGFGDGQWVYIVGIGLRW